MALRIASFNAENLLSRFDFSGFRNDLRRDRAVQLYDIGKEAVYQQVEMARTISLTDDTRQLTALAIADCFADILCLQEVESLDTLHAFEYGYLFKMAGAGYRQKYLVEGNDGRGIDVAILMREETAQGEPIVFERLQSHAHLTYEMLDLWDPVLADRARPGDRIFKRDCLEVDVRVGGKPFTFFLVHFKSMGPGRNGTPGREWTMPVRQAEARAVRHIISERFGGKTANKRFAICGDLNDYREKVVIEGDRRNGFTFEPRREEVSALDLLLDDGFVVNPVERRAVLDRWTLYHTRGPEERHLCQLDYVLLSPRLAQTSGKAVPEIIRAGQPYRTIFPPGQALERYPRTGWDRPKASDHCPVVVEVPVI
ncbi:endonuclease/exonuclease/phosphatase family protein [Pseudohoeflea coraliihabitans]|uniref:Endonuclease n=1 Tax=Pseudohoeflea coraliihabitans TaxID=2860393 RepID=A0ABS6WIV6_9HYPH|nr:endonuclease/exonuclease/phosphatase family protein [Pseudohoeflea sp. DP4N28-3]MBW3095861.1 endonuclease [Pseudohoeflea sp. DP4N28-3]